MIKNVFTIFNINYEIFEIEKTRIIMKLKIAKYKILSQTNNLMFNFFTFYFEFFNCLRYNFQLI